MLSRSEIIQEYAKCWNNYGYVIETYFKTFDQTQKGFVPFKLFPKQREIISAYEKHRFNLVTKPRQAGVSTTTAAYSAALVGFADKENPQAVLILANKQDMAFEFLAKIKEFLLQLPRWVWGPDYYGSEENEKKSIFIKDSQKEISLPNKSRVKAVATSKDALRGYTPTFLIMDEAAFIDNGDVVFGAALTALGTGGRSTLISTPNGLDSLYYKTYAQSKAGKNDFNVIEMKWYEDLRYNKDLKWLKEDELIEDTIKSFANNEKMLKDGYKPTSSWYEDMCRGMNNNAKMIAQELDVSFIGSGGNVIENEYIEFHEKENVQDPVIISGPEQEFWIWEEPIEGHQYLLAADVSRGDGNDYSTIEIIDFTTMTQVFEYQGKVPPNIFAQIIYEYGNKYKAYSVVDNIGVGAATILPLLEMNYKYLHYDDPKNKMLIDKRSFRSYDKGDKIAGFAVGNVRLPMVANFERAIRENEIKIRSTRLINEMKTFVYQNGKPNHMSGYNDDCLKEGTLIKTINGYKKIEELVVGELVLTHMGRYRAIEKLMMKPFNGDWYDMNFQGQVNLGLSYNHPLYAATNSSVVSGEKSFTNRDWVTPDKWLYKDDSNKLRGERTRLSQISIKESLSDNINYIIKEEFYYTRASHEQSNITSEIVLDINFSKFLGLFLADGHSVKPNDVSQRYVINIAFHVKDELLCQEMEGYLNSLGSKSSRSKVKGSRFVLITSNKLLWTVLSECYDSNREKQLPPYSKYLGNDLEYTLEYWLKPNGWVDKIHKTYDIIGATTSKSLALSMRDIAWSVGKYAVLREVKRHRYGKPCKNQFWVHIRNDFRQDDRLQSLSTFEYGTKTVKITKSNYNGIVYNLQVADDTSFVANGIVVHNCIMAMSMGLWVLEHSFKKLEKVGKQTKAILSSWVMGSNVNSPSTGGFVPKELSGKVQLPKPNFSPNVSKNMQDPRGDYLWLFSGMK